MKKFIAPVVTTMIALSLLTACTNRQMGTVGGAAIGGIAGSAITGGSTAGTVVGAVGGGLIGNSVAR